MQEFYWIAVALVTVVSSARITRLFVYDEFPPIEWVRLKLGAVTAEQIADNKWKLLAVCGFCMSFWVTALVVVAGLLAHVYGHPPNDPGLAFTAWWVVTGIFAASYLAAMTVARDGDKS